MTLPTSPAGSSMDLDFLVIGAMKSATTSLCHWLDAQSGIELSVPKEPRIFVDDASVESWCGRVGELFPEGQERRSVLRGEGSTDYTKRPGIAGVPGRAAAACPGLRIVYVVRHPLDRARSHLAFHWLLGGAARTFASAVEEVPGLVDYGRYDYQLRAWLEVFASEKVLVVFAESFAAHPVRQVEAVMRHLGLDPSGPVVVPEETRSNESASLVRPSVARRLLRESRLGRAARPWVPDVVVAAYRWSLRTRSRPRLGRAVEADLVARFDADLAGLAQTLGLESLTCENWTAVVSGLDPIVVPAADARSSERVVY